MSNLRAGKRLFSRVTLNVSANKIHAFCCERAETSLPMNGNFVMLYKYSLSFHTVKYRKLPTEKHFNMKILNAILGITFLF